MESYRSARQFGAFMILLTLLFRLFEIGIPQRILRREAPPGKTVHIQTGQTVRSFSLERLLPYIAESAPPRDAVPPRPEFRESDAEAVALKNTAAVTPDLGTLIAAPLRWSLADTVPTVLILHTHSTESYTKSGEEYAESAAFRTLEGDYNMLSIGNRVAQLLEQGGIRVIHDRELHDYPSYNTAYTHARKSTQAVLAENPGILLVLDLHRDAMEDASGQVRTTAQIRGKSGAQLMFVMGAGNAGLPHPQWEQNLSLALKLQYLLEQQCPGLCRPISLRPQRYNQDLSTGALLVEIGTAGNTHAEALRAAEELAAAILKLKNGSL